MKRKLTILFLLGVINCFAQIPGYKGKKFFIGFDGYTFLSASNYNKNFEKGITTFRSIYGGSIDYVIGRSASIGFRTTRGSAGCIYESIHANNYYDYDQNTYVYTSSANSIYEYSSSSYALFFKLFPYKRKGNLAPIGAYKEIGMQWNIDKLKNLAGYEESGKKTFQYPLISFGLGFRNIYFNRIITDFGAQFGMPISTKIVTTKLSAKNMMSDYFEGELEDVAMSRAFGMYSVNFKFGIGVLIF